MIGCQNQQGSEFQTSTHNDPTEKNRPNWLSHAGIIIIIIFQQRFARESICPQMHDCARIPSLAQYSMHSEKTTCENVHILTQRIT